MRRLTLFLVLTSYCSCQESAQYLQNAVRDLRKIHFRQTLRRADTKLVQDSITQTSIMDVMPTTPTMERRVVYNTKNVPPLSLTKGELAALYENAVAKGETIKLNAGDNSFVHAAVAELDGSESKPQGHTDNGNTEDSSGYYYYYYPIKSFMDEITSNSGGSDRFHFTKPEESKPDMTHYHPPDNTDHQEYYHDHPPHDVHYDDEDEKAKYNYHSHHHQHNINITHVKSEMEEKKAKPLEPLFMAISGFIGMALMFVVSVILFPKFSLKPNPNKKANKNERIADIARIALSAIEGEDCTERFACELGKTARSFNVNDNRFVKLLKRISPSTFGKHIDKVGRYSNKRLKCTAIPCKKKPPPNKNNNNKKNQNAHKKS